MTAPAKRGPGMPRVGGDVPTQRVTVRLPGPVVEAYEAEAERRGVKPAVLIREAIEDGAPSPADELTREAEDLGMYDAAAQVSVEEAARLVRARRRCEKETT